MTRTVADAAALLAVIADRLGPVTFNPGDLRGVRLGVARTAPADADRPRLDVHEAALDALRAAGAVLVDVTLPAEAHDDELAVLHHEFAPAMGEYLAALGAGATRRSLAEIQAWNREHAGVALKFGQVHVDAAVAIDHARAAPEYRAIRARDLAAATSGLAGALGDDLECLVFPGADGCGWAARAGWPSIVVPAGYTASSRRPVGVMFVSRPWTDARLLALASAFESAHPVRRPPAEINPAAFRRFA
jgi:amidase